MTLHLGTPGEKLNLNVVVDPGRAACFKAAEAAFEGVHVEVRPGEDQELGLFEAAISLDDAAVLDGLVKKVDALQQQMQHAHEA